jgi:hypothetical protein
MLTTCAAAYVQVISELQQQLAEAQQHGQELAAAIEHLEAVQTTMKEKLRGYKHRYGLRPALYMLHDPTHAKGTGVVCSITAWGCSACTKICRLDALAVLCAAAGAQTWKAGGCRMLSA